MGAAAHVGTHTEHRVVRKIQQKSHRHAALRFRTSAPSAPAKSIVYVTRPRAKCRRWVKPHERAGYVIPLSGLQRLPIPVTLTRIRALEPTLAAVLADLKRKYGEPLYFPFELSPSY